MFNEADYTYKINNVVQDAKTVKEFKAKKASRQTMVFKILRLLKNQRREGII